ncbi:MAG: hypothetical protein ACAH04_04325 [Methylibium sp.]
MRRSSPPAQCSPSTDDVWGEVSAGVNFFNFGTGTTVFAKVDVTFRDDLSGVGGNAGMLWPGRHENEPRHAECQRRPSQRSQRLMSASPACP